MSDDLTAPDTSRTTSQTDGMAVTQKTALSPAIRVHVGTAGTDDGQAPRWLERPLWLEASAADIPVSAKPERCAGGGKAGAALIVVWQGEPSQDPPPRHWISNLFGQRVGHPAGRALRASGRAPRYLGPGSGRRGRKCAFCSATPPPSGPRKMMPSQSDPGALIVLRHNRLARVVGELRIFPRELSAGNGTPTT